MDNFKLEKLLRHRKRIEEKKEKELAEVNSRLKKEREKLSSYLIHEVNHHKELQARQIRSITVAENSLYSNFLRKLTEKIKDQEKLSEEVQSQVNQKREELVRAMKEKKLLEKLKDKNDLAVKKSILNSEGKFLDEIGVNKFNRE